MNAPAKALVLAGLIIVSFGSGVFLSNQLQTNPLSQINRSMTQLRGSTYGTDKHSLIDPLLTCESATLSEQSQFSRILKPRLNALIEQAKQNNDATQISIYFDTRDGRWFGLNTDEHYYPASMLKVPVMMTYFKMAEADPKFLAQKNIFSQEEKTGTLQYFPPTNALKVGQTYTNEDLIEHMIQFSDNDALDILLKNLPSTTPLAEIFTDLGLPLPHADPNQTIDFMSVKSYAYFFRVLYNASYLDREYSKKALELLGHTNFNHGLTAPLPNDLTVAHKFGERTITASTGSMTQELHDCGIIYFPRRPYLLCIMTKGTNPDVLANQIEKISKTVYDFMNTEWQTE